MGPLKIKNSSFLLFFIVVTSAFLNVETLRSKETNLQNTSNDFIKQLPSIKEKTNKDLYSNDYIIGPGDLLRINIIDLPELSENIRVINDGTASIPILGSISLSGLTLNEASKLIRSLLDEQIIRPDIQLIIVNPRPMRISLVGEVERPGLYSMTMSEVNYTEGDSQISTKGFPTIVDAIRKAGGITKDANLRNIQLRRRLPGINAEYKQANIDLISLIRDGNQKQNPYLFDGDIIILKKSTSNTEEFLEYAASNLSPKEIDVYIIGEVLNPGLQRINVNTPLSQAVLMAGGIKDIRINKANIEMVRLNRNGSVSKRRFKMNLNANTSNKNNPPLQNGDIIKVNTNIFGRSSDTISAISSPFSGILNIYTFFKIIGDD